MSRSVYGRKKTPKRQLRTNGRSPELHCMKVPAESETLLLPTTVMAEVIEYSKPQPMDSAAR